MNLCPRWLFPMQKAPAPNSFLYPCILTWPLAKWNGVPMLENDAWTGLTLHLAIANGWRSMWKGSQDHQPMQLYGLDWRSQLHRPIRGNSIQGKHWKNSDSIALLRLLIGRNWRFLLRWSRTFNDLFKDGKPSKDDWLPTKIGNEVSIGSGSTILPVKICDGVVGAGSVVVRDLTVGHCMQNPAKLIREIWRIRLTCPKHSKSSLLQKL